MASVKYFRLIGRWRGFTKDDKTDVDEDPQFKGVNAGVTITASTSKNRPVMKASTLSPNASLISLWPIEARLDDGRLKVFSDSENPAYDQPDVKFVANCPALGLDPDEQLIYTLTPHDATANGGRVSLPSMSFIAPTIAETHNDILDGEVRVDWAQVEWIEQGQLASGGTLVRNVPDGVVRTGLTIQFMNGVTALGAPIDISDLIFQGTADDITDSTAVGRAVLTAATQAAARAAIGAGTGGGGGTDGVTLDTAQTITGEKTFTADTRLRNLFIDNNDADTARVVFTNSDAAQVFEFGVNTAGTWSVWDTTHSKGPLTIESNSPEGALAISPSGNSMTSPLSMLSHRITEVADPVDAQDVVTKAWGQANLGGTGSGPVSFMSPASKSLYPSSDVVSYTVDTTDPAYSGQRHFFFKDADIEKRWRFNGSWFDASNNPVNQINGGTTSEFNNSTSYEVEFYVSGDRFAFALLNTSVKDDFRVYVDDMPLTSGWSYLSSSLYDSNRVKVQFATSRVRKIRLLSSGLISFTGVLTPGSASIWAAPPRFRVAVVGDSYVQGGFDAGTDGWLSGGGLCNQLAILTGWEVLNLGQANTGYVNDAAGSIGKSAYGSGARLSALAALPPLDLIIIFGSANDVGYSAGSVTAAANTYWNAVKAARPDTPIVVAGVESGSLAGFDPAQMDTLNAALITAAKANPNVTGVIDMRTDPWWTGTGFDGSPEEDGNADFFISIDGRHPTRAGFEDLAQRIADDLADLTVGDATGGGSGGSGPASTDALPEGSINKYFTDSRADARADSRITAAIGSTVQGFDSDISGIAALVVANSKTIYKDGSGNWATADLTAFARSILDDADAATVRATIGAQAASEKGAANGYAPLDSSALIPAVYLPSYVDDILEFTNLANFPTIGETGKIYVDKATGKIHRWTGSTYVEISPSPGSTDAVPEGASNLYFTNSRADARVTAGITAKADKTTTVSAGTGLTGGGDLSANRSLAVAYGTTAGTAAQGNDSRLSDARTPTAHTHAVSDLTVSGTPNGAKFLRDDGSWATPSSTPVVAAQSTPIASETTSSSTYTDLATTTDQVTVTVGSSGIVQVAITSYMKTNAVGSEAWCSFAVSGANTLAASDDRSIMMSTASSSGHAASGVFVLTGLNPGSTTFKMKFRRSANTAEFARRQISVIAF